MRAPKYWTSYRLSNLRARFFFYYILRHKLRFYWLLLSESGLTGFTEFPESWRVDNNTLLTTE